MTNIIGIIQARMGSSRIPGKAMIDLAGKPLIWHMIDRMRRVKGITELILATTDDPRNKPLIDYCKSQGLKAFQHPEEDDLAGRISGAIRNVAGDIVLKTGGDCPLIDPAVLQKMVDIAVAEGNADFVSNRVQWSYPLGLSADVISRKAIEWCDKNLSKPEDRELFALYVRDHTERFKVVPVINGKDLSHHVWTVDEPEDLVFMRRIFDALYVKDQVFSMEDVLAFLAGETQLRNHGE
jgi:spore coat polysaccharide biosynthesis protein SpsF